MSVARVAERPSTAESHQAVHETRGITEWYRQSRAHARTRLRDRRARFKHATVTLDLDEMVLALEVSRLPSPMSRGLWRQFTGLIMFPEDVRRTQMHLEVLKNLGRDGFLLRMVSRGYTRHGTPPCRDLREFIFHVPADPMSVIAERSDPSGHSDWSLPRLTPTRLVDGFTSALECVVLLGGVMMHVGAIYHNGRLHRVGENAEVGTPVESEVASKRTR